MVIDGFIDWLFVDDLEVRGIAELEQAMIRHHLGVGVDSIHWSIMQQAMRQDPGLYALAIALHVSGSTALVNHNLPTDT